MCRILRASATLVLLFALAPIPSPATATKGVVHWACSTPLLPDMPASSSDNDPDVGEGVSYLYVGSKHLTSDYAVDAAFTLPSAGKRGWYGNSIRLGPLVENNGWVQIMLVREPRFDYRAHVAVAWGLPHTSVVYFKDTGIAYSDDRPHRLGISVAKDKLLLWVDGRELCSTSAAQFASSRERKYFQVRSEVGVIGSAGAGTVRDIRLKTDVDRSLMPLTIACEMRRHGVAWYETGPGMFDVRGAYYANEATIFTGTDPNAPCRT